MKITSTSVSKNDGTVWATVDVDSLDTDVLKAYQAYKEAARKASELRQEFEALFRTEAGTEGIRFGYNYGKLSIAQGEAPKPKAAPKPSVSLSDFLTGRLSSGLRA